MAKNTYPNTGQEPCQSVIFTFVNGLRMTATLFPQPDYSRTQVNNVEVDSTFAGETLQNRISKQNQKLTVFQAGELAFQAAESEAKRIGSLISEVSLEGQEFLEISDIQQISNNQLPVTAY